MSHTTLQALACFALTSAAWFFPLNTFAAADGSLIPDDPIEAPIPEAVHIDCVGGFCFHPVLTDLVHEGASYSVVDVSVLVCFGAVQAQDGKPQPVPVCLLADPRSVHPM